jgi:hypothetical protein
VISQSEGGIVQGLSWALKEQLTFDNRAITSLDWSGYPIMTFDEIPSIEAVLLDQPNQPSLGAGEGTVGPASAAECALWRRLVVFASQIGKRVITMKTAIIGLGNRCHHLKLTKGISDFTA